MFHIMKRIYIALIYSKHNYQTAKRYILHAKHFKEGTIHATCALSVLLVNQLLDAPPLVMMNQKEDVNHNKCVLPRRHHMTFKW